MNNVEELKAELQRDLEVAVEFHQKGDVFNAERIYLEILDRQPDNKIVIFLLSQVEGSLDTLNNSSVSANIMLDAFKEYQSHYSAVLPYNINWMLEKPSSLHGFLSQYPIIVTDIGARGGHLGELAGLKQYLKYYGYDADTKECARLAASAVSGFVDHRILPYYVGKEDGPVNFNIYRSPGDSSRLQPNERFQKEFNPNLVIEQEVQVDSARLDTIIRKEKLDWPDFIKLDTQGTELEILHSSPISVSNAMLVETEVEFIEMYQGQHLYHDVAAYMYDKGFDLLYLNRVFQTRPQYGGEARGQITFGDALFGRRENGLNAFAPEAIAKYAVLLVNYGHRDLAERIWRAFESVRVLVPGLSSYFEPYCRDEKRIVKINNDKLLSWQLYCRRTNQIGFEGDRSWPIR